MAKEEINTHELNTIRKPVIISFDLEVSPALGYFYPPTWETGILKVQERQVLMSFAWQDVSQKKISALSLADMDTFGVDPHNDKLLSIELHKVLSSADIILGQNSDQFDIKMANYFFIKNGLPPIPPHKSIDTKKIAKRYFRFPNNTLDTLGEELGVGGKTKITVKDLWEDCFIRNDPKAYKKLVIYNKNDVRVTTAIYKEMMPFMRNHPNMLRLTGESDGCTRCGSFSYRIRAYRTNDTSKWRQYQCNDCHGFFTDRKPISEKEGDIKPNFKPA